MTKAHYAKKREPVVAAQWTGTITPDMQELVGDRTTSIDGDRQLVFANAKGPGRFARVGDWIVSASGEDMAVVGDEAFRRTYEAVDENGRRLPPTDAEHEESFREFVGKLDALLVDALRLSREQHPAIFRGRDQLLRALRGVLEDHAAVAERRELARVRDKIKKDLWP